ANRLGASALMQGLADGYFVLPYTIGSYLSKELATKPIPLDHPAFVEAENNVKATIDKFLSINGTKSVDHFHKRLGHIMWEKCGMARNREGLTQAIKEIQDLRREFWADVRVPGSADEFNPELEKAHRVADFIELGELMCIDALNREESCGGHFREEHQTEEGEAKRDDENYAYVAAWEYKGVSEFELHKEELNYENIKVAQRNYK
ncbi:MAG: fumarate reductase/succinate dehydrogenase flavoprotein subunit, partial [Flavobacterium sp.]